MSDFISHHFYYCDIHSPKFDIGLLVIWKTLSWMEIEDEDDATSLKYYYFVTLMLPADVALQYLLTRK